MCFVKMLLWIVISIVLGFLGLGGVAFVTLLERKLLGLSQIRLGPNKVTLNGILQPVMDGVKLLFKQLHMVSPSQNILFTMSPGLLLVLFIVAWSWLLPWSGSMFFLKYSSLVFFSLLGVGAYMVILTGWSSASSFSKLGSLRGILQSLSFEVALILVFMMALSFFSAFSFSSNIALEVELMILWLILWLILSLMETNRAPFDLLEGESELISGFNIEMSSLTFVFLFLSEYGMIIVLSLIMSLVLIGGVTMLGMLYISVILFLRSCYPRIRYDIMMTMMWEMVLPLSVFMFMIFSFFK